MSDRFPHLLSPLTVGPITLRNRVLITAHVPGVEEDGLAGPDYLAYHRARAEGGAGLQLSGSSAVAATGGVGGGRSLDLSSDRAVEPLSRLAEAVHGAGGRFLVQLGHAGATVNDTDAGRPLLAPSPVMSRLARETPKEMTGDDIAEIVQAHAEAAVRVRASGLDGVELLGAFGFLVGAFLSPYSNRRTDAYGGPLENRLRFAREVIAATRAAIGPDRILGLRMPGDERVEGGLGREDLREIARLLASDGDLDYLNVIVGTNYDRHGRMEHWPPTPAPHGLFAELAAGVREVVNIPVFTTGRVTDPALAEAILARGQADMVGMTRAHIADPRIVAKIEAGRLEDIRPCVGANLCIARAMEGKAIRCLHNPETARERAWGKAGPAETPLHVAVIGGGPAGLEAARVAAERGHRVTLHEAGEALGGQLRLWAEAPMTREFGRILTWYEEQLTRLQVVVRRGSAVDADGLGLLDADAIVLATGARPAAGAPIPGVEGSGIAVADPWSVIAEPPEGLGVVVVDEGGGRAALSAADALAERNRVTVVTAEFMVGELVTPTVRTPIYRRFAEQGVVLRPNEEVARLDLGTVVTRNVHGGAETRIEDVQMVVNWRGAETVDGLLAAAQATGKPVHQVGDCVAPRQVHMAIAEGALAARAL